MPMAIRWKRRSGKGISEPGSPQRVQIPSLLARRQRALRDHAVHWRTTVNSVAIDRYPVDEAAALPEARAPDPGSRFLRLIACGSDA